MASSSSSALSDVSHSCSDKSSPAQNKNDVRIEHTVLEEGKSADADVENEGQEGQGANLPRADGGGKAWLFLAGCFVFEALIWGFPFSFGVFQSYYTTHPPFVEHAGSVAVIGTCSTGVMYLFAPVSLYVLEAWPSIRRRTSVFGLMLIVSTLMASSFSTAVWHLILTQGVLYAIGGSLLYAPTVFYLDEWFVKKKGLAFGIMWGGVGTSGLVFPFLLTCLLNNYGFRTTLRIWSIVLLVLCAPLIYFVRARLPIPTSQIRRNKISFRFLLTRSFVALQASNILESLGFFLPSIYLPSYARSIGLSPLSGTILLALLNSFSVIGAITLGYLCDRLHVTTVIKISTLGSTLSVLLFWGMGGRMEMLVVFAAVYGGFAGGYSAIWTGMYKAVQEQSPEAGMGTLMGLFSAGRGIGAVLSGPVSEVLLNHGGFDIDGLKVGYGSKYGAMIVFTGVTAACGIVCFGARWRKS